MSELGGGAILAHRHLTTDKVELHSPHADGGFDLKKWKHWATGAGRLVSTAFAL
jgi:hypothetical protein